MTYIGSPACLSLSHCRTCRALESGRAWRVSLGNVFELPPGAPDFACPHGKPWGWRPPAGWTPDQKSRGLGDTIAKITHAVGIEPCGGCKERQAKLNALLPYKGESNSEKEKPAGASD